jgi:hypothetical protein
MDNRIGRLGLLVVALGIGAAFAAIPGVASADTFDPNNFAISIDGLTLFQVGTATGGIGDVASAFGAGSHAFVDRGNFDVADASGLDSTATADFGNGDTALANTDFSTAAAGGDAASLGNNDFASATGAVTFAYANAGSFNFAAIFDPGGTMGGDASAGTGNGDFAYVIGDGDLDRAGGVSSALLGNYDIAEIFGNELDALAATGGNFLVDLAPPL